MSQQFPHLFSPLTIGSVELKNRTVFTGHATCLTNDGFPNDALVAYHHERALGGAGLIVTQVANVHPSGWNSTVALKIFGDESILHYQRIARAVHPYDCRLFGQIFHPGREAHYGTDGLATRAYAPSAIPTDRFRCMPRAMSTDFIGELVESFAEAARRLQEAGFDGAEIVASQGYLIAQFLNPRANVRTDQYGGSVENRTRVVREIVAKIRARAPGLVVGLRISGDELDGDGLQESEAAAVCEALSREGLDYLSVIAGTSQSLGGAIHIVPQMAFEAGYLAPYSQAIKERVTCPVIVTGRINQPQIAEQIIATSQADACGMTRAMICDSHMAAKANAGNSDDIRACIGCNQACIGHFHRGYPVSCIQHPESGRELQYRNRKMTKVPRNIMVVGGGPAGMKAAAVAAERGHQVTLYERGRALGGQALLAQLLPGRAEFGGIITNLRREMTVAGVTVKLNTEVNASLVAEVHPDAVIIATGAKPWRPDIEGSDEAHVVDAWAVIAGEANVGSAVAIADWRGDWVGIGVAEKLARDGCSVRLYVNAHGAGEALPNYTRDEKLGVLHKLGVEIIPMVKLFGVDEDTVYFEHLTSREAVLAENIDTLVLALATDVDDELYYNLGDFPGDIHLIGDCATPRTAEEAVYDGLKVAVQL